jgi:para-nitrobenzyl esterase
MRIKMSMRRALVMAAALAAGTLSLTAAAVPAPVHFDGGWAQGTTENGMTVYEGIPFAAPPVGPLRWRDPQPPASWSGVLHADHFGPSCIQAHLRMPGMPPMHMSEDCLYLNVWTPAKSAYARLPVMVWIYGGGFMFGSTAQPLYDGARLAAHGVVVVSIAYRVGAMGFLALPALNAESAHQVSGNYGLLDQIAGLSWVKRNIAALGGDPGRVTIFGESAGAISVSILAASPLAHGLFAGAISESGGSFGPPRLPPHPGENVPTLAEADQTGLAFERQLGVSSLAQMRQLPPERIQRASAPVGEFWPVLDGYLIPGDQYILYEEGRYNDTPVLIGTNSDEGVIFGAAPSRSAYVREVHQCFGPFAARILEAYPATRTGWRQASLDVMRDTAFGWGTWSWARLQARTGTSKVYMYYFDHIPPRQAHSPWRNAVGAVHSEEMVYVFQHLSQSPTLHWTAIDRELAGDMGTYWTNFAKYGNPNGPAVPHWPAFTDARPAVMHLTNAPHVGGVANPEQLRTLNAYFAWRRTPQGTAWASSQHSRP